MHRQQGYIFRHKVKQKDGTIWISPNYSIAYYVGTKKKREVVGPIKKEAIRVLNERLQALHNQTYREVTDTTFGKYVEVWLKGLGALKPSTGAAYKSIIEKNFAPAFNNYPLSAIGVEQVNEYLADLAERSVKPKT